MVGLAQFLPGAAPDGLRRPRAEIDIGADGADAWAEHLVGCEVDCGLLPFVDRVRLNVAPQGPRPAPGDDASIALGYEDAGVEPVFSGRVVGLRERSAGAHQVILAGAGHALATSRANQSFEQQTAGDIVGALAQAAGVTMGTGEAGTSFPYLCLDDRRSMLDQIAELAHWCGFVAHVDAADQLEFRALGAGSPVASFGHGVDILALRVLQSDAVASTITMVGEGAAGSEGQDAWSWLLKDPAPVTTSADTNAGGAARLRAIGALRSADAVRTAADGAVAGVTTFRPVGEIDVAGTPLARPGSTIEIGDVPVSSLNGTRLVTGVAHRFSKNGGFTTTIRFAAGAGGGGGLLGGLL